jgi:hypothetical protein
MARAIILDTGPLGLVTNPRGSAEAIACNDWLQDHLAKGTRVVVPEIADYEVRRELLRANKRAGVQRLNTVKSILDYVPITTESMLLAAELWADARRQGRGPRLTTRRLTGTSSSPRRRDCLVWRPPMSLLPPSMLATSLGSSRPTPGAGFPPIEERTGT